MNPATALRTTSEPRTPRALTCRAEAAQRRRLTSASTEIFRKTRASRGRSAAYRFGAYRDFAYVYEKPRQDRQSLQTDPVGYEDDLNLYAYVRNDPLNAIDPTGMEIEVELRGYRLGTNPLSGKDFGHAYVQATDSETGESVIMRGGPSEAYPGGASGAASNRGAGNAAGDGRITIFVQVDPESASPDSGYARDAGGSEVLQSVTMPEETTMSDVTDSMNGFRDQMNDAGTEYRPQTDNSNMAAGAGYTAVTGDWVDENEKYPGITRRPQ